ncbi:MAG: hypothetical protein SWK76_12450 [Actinomycetota bacterium]|nr:hypothetical protein [Actinomycetota bacterium]
MDVRKMLKKGSLCLVALSALSFMLTLVLFFPGAGAEPSRMDDIEVKSFEAVIMDTDHAWEIEKVRVVTWLALKREDTVDVNRPDFPGGSIVAGREELPFPRR